MNSYFYLHAEKNPNNADFINTLEEYSKKNKSLVYILNSPLTDQKYNYSYKESIIILSPKHKVTIVNFGNNDSEFEDYVEDLIEDIGSISDKYQYKNILGRPRQWRDQLIKTYSSKYDLSSTLFDDTKLQDDKEIKKIDLLISLFIGSINDIERVKENVPTTTLDKVKQKIQLFDGDQTRFIYQKPNKKRIAIQGLSGTGKTELLLHKLKDIYIKYEDSKVYFTCHNKILADSLRKRIPSFFNFMKVEQQIEWEIRLWCTHAWGSRDNVYSGTYRYICAFYGLSFNKYSKINMSFSRACEIALSELREMNKNEPIEPAFTHMFIDESQDFDENFFQLCESVTKENIYIAGDIFQNIFDEKISSSIKPDFLLGKCYRTDPKTLMFAHGLGMGLFEAEKLRWLEKKEWEDCGYKVDVINNKFYLSREPLRRFEDLEDSFESIKIVESNDLSVTIIDLISEIILENETVKPEDIGIILLDENKDIYKIADMLEMDIYLKIRWKVNKAYETKENLKNSIFISNRNNVKGLEFPFIICITKSITINPSYRNTLYTMLTRSFIKSFLVISKSLNSGLTSGMKEGLNEIVKHNQMIIQEPSVDEKRKIQTKFEYRSKKRSYYDMMMDIFYENNIEKIYHEKIFKLVASADLIESDFEILSKFVVANINFIKNKI